jgi:hypothetical protein
MRPPIASKRPRANTPRPRHTGARPRFRFRRLRRFDAMADVSRKRAAVPLPQGVGAFADAILSARNKRLWLTELGISYADRSGS